jgi:8-oxo-dGTP diphosphatase
MARRQIQVVGAMLEGEKGRYLITQRRPTATLPLLWEFPGGRVEEGETPQAALARELLEEMGISVDVADQVIHTRHEYPNYDIDFRVYSCRLAPPRQQVQNLGVHDHRWVTLAEMGSYQFPAADARTLAQLLELEDAG